MGIDALEIGNLLLSGRYACSVFTEQTTTWELSYSIIVPDDVDAIQQQVNQLSDDDDYVNFVVTTGGTGFAVKDRTPEAIKPMLDRDAPGLVYVCYTYHACLN